jgi:hypothetical protein
VGSEKWHDGARTLVAEPSDQAEEKYGREMPPILHSPGRALEDRVRKVEGDDEDQSRQDATEGDGFGRPHAFLANSVNLPAGGVAERLD